MITQYELVCLAVLLLGLALSVSGMWWINSKLVLWLGLAAISFPIVAVFGRIAVFSLRHIMGW